MVESDLGTLERLALRLQRSTRWGRAGAAQPHPCCVQGWACWVWTCMCGLIGTQSAWDARAMRRLGQVLTKAPVISAAFVCMAAALAGCSAASPAAGPAAARSSPAATVPSAGAIPSAGAAFAFTVAGARPVPPNGSQDTHAQTPDAACDSARFAADEAVGLDVANGFALASFSVSADLLSHFLKGTGTEVDYRAGSSISQQALSSSVFNAVNHKVQRAILRQLKAGKTRVRLSGAQLPHGGVRGQEQRPVLGISRHAGLDRNRKRQPQERTVRRNALVRHTGQLRIPGQRCARAASARR